MAKIGVCIESFFSDLPYKKRIEKIAKLGYTSYEFWFHDKRFDGKGLVPEMKNFDEIAELNAKYGLVTNDFVFNHPDGGIVAALINKKDRNKLLDSIEEMIGYAKKIKCKSFISGSGNKIAGLKKEKAVEAMVDNLKALAPICEKAGITLILEAFNSKVNHPDYFLDDPFLTMDVLKAVGSPKVKMLYDIYHMQIMSGNILDFVKENLSLIGHFHIAGVPGRHEPFGNELDYRFIVQSIEKMGYKGAFGLEYWPTMKDDLSLKQTKKYFGI